MVGAALERALALGGGRLRAEEGEAEHGHGGDGEPAADGEEHGGDEDEVEEEEEADVRRVGEGEGRVVDALHGTHGAREGRDGGDEVGMQRGGERGLERAPERDAARGDAHLVQAVERLVRGGEQRAALFRRENALELPGAPGLGAEVIFYRHREGHRPAKELVAMLQ